MVRKPPFIEYFIRRKNTLPEMGQEIEHIIANRKALRKIKLFGMRRWHEIDWIQGIPLLYVYVPTVGRVFLVKRKDTGKHEPWLEDYLECPSPDWYLMGVLNCERATRAAAWRKAQA